MKVMFLKPYLSRVFKVFVLYYIFWRIQAILKNKKQLQNIGEGSRDGSAKKYSKKGGRDGNQYNRHPGLHYTRVHTGITQHSFVPCGANCE